jgi:Tol biopolymer transport system component
MTGRPTAAYSHTTGALVRDICNCQPVLSPDGRKLAHTVDKNDMITLYVADSNGRNPRRVARGQLVDEVGVAWQPLAASGLGR